jgi:lysophospholipase L1-like esterase
MTSSPYQLVPPLILAVALFFCWRSRAAAADHPFEKEIKTFEAEDRQHPPPKGAILFVGDSTFTKWMTMHEDLSGYTVINRGFGGSTMPDLLYFTSRIVFPYQPRMIVVQEGGNDLHARRTPEQLLGDFKAFVEQVRTQLPEVPILLGSITPNPARWSEVELRKKANRLTEEYAATQSHVTYVNFFDPFLGPDGQPREELFMEDRLHPSHEGYAVRVRILQSLLAPESPKADSAR